MRIWWSGLTPRRSERVEVNALHLFESAPIRAIRGKNNHKWGWKSAFPPLPVIFTLIGPPYIWPRFWQQAMDRN
jgi:hypothetical protein